MMSKKPNHIYKSKVMKKLPLSKSGPSLSNHSNQSKYLDRRTNTFQLKSILSAVKYHSWESKYQQSFTREKLQKAMIKNTYALPIYSMAHADESIVTKEEVCPILISADNIHIEQPIIHRQTKVTLPRIVRYVRNNDDVLSKLFVQQTSKNNENLSNRIKIQNDTSFIRKPSRRFILDTILEEIPECCSSDNCSCDIALSSFRSTTTLVL